jgi:hypothetical protein
LTNVLSLIGENLTVFSRNEIILIKAANKKRLLIFIVQISMPVDLIPTPFSLIEILIRNWFPLWVGLAMIGRDKALE